MKATKLPPSITSLDAAHAWLYEHWRPGLVIVQLAHDDFCPAIHTQRDADCKPPCRPDVWLIEPFADARDN